MNPNILIVEDNEAVRSLLCKWLGMTFPKCVFLMARNGEEALYLALSKSPQIVLMDIGLPGMNGIETARALHAASPEVRIVMLTILEDPEYQTDAMQAGACAYVTKGKMHSELVPIVTSLLARVTGVDGNGEEDNAHRGEGSAAGFPATRQGKCNH